MVFSKQKYWDREIKVLSLRAKFGTFKAQVEGQVTKFGFLKAGCREKEATKLTFF